MLDLLKLGWKKNKLEWNINLLMGQILHKEIIQKRKNRKTDYLLNYQITSSISASSKHDNLNGLKLLY